MFLVYIHYGMALTSKQLKCGQCGRHASVLEHGMWVEPKLEHSGQFPSSVQLILRVLDMNHHRGQRRCSSALCDGGGWLGVGKGPGAPLRLSSVLSRPASGIARSAVMTGVDMARGLDRQ